MDGGQLCQLGPSEDHHSNAAVSKPDGNLILWRYSSTLFL